MPTVSSRHAVVARIIVCACAIVCGCSKPESPSSDTPARSEPSALPATTATSELQDWAKQATDVTDATAPPAMARAASEPLATPVIHTVD
ncbi:hypothetical protein BSFA1_47790 [Burkholderia sp. SFA1]|uniref:hypothetical protein n=1 Tax=Caballeronia sp. CLC5 TaxID=2906764 RepID=UPI001F2BACC1|nr:hypothetical protein [Caballeronia sp. CLC5]MCE4574266.1 hypothetical protein [Caballeronia sp. CLC5]BBP99650.1 hypothetical protein BSFA1_47790 [Burkholderia sp. SFA1]